MLVEHFVKRYASTNVMRARLSMRRLVSIVEK